MSAELERQAFLNALEDNPCDWDTRMVYADWLDDHDQPEEATRQRKWKEAYETVVRVVRPYADEFPEDGTPDPKEVLAEIDRRHEQAVEYGSVCFGYDESPQMMRDESTERAFWEAVEVLTGKPNPMYGHPEEISYRCAC